LRILASFLFAAATGIGHFCLTRRETGVNRPRICSLMRQMAHAAGSNEQLHVGWHYAFPVTFSISAGKLLQFAQLRRKLSNENQVNQTEKPNKRSLVPKRAHMWTWEHCYWLDNNGPHCSLYWQGETRHARCLA